LRIYYFKLQQLKHGRHYDSKNRPLCFALLLQKFIIFQRVISEIPRQIAAKLSYPLKMGVICTVVLIFIYFSAFTLINPRDLE